LCGIPALSFMTRFNSEPHSSEKHCHYAPWLCFLAVQDVLRAAIKLTSVHSLEVQSLVEMRHSASETPDVGKNVTEQGGLLGDNWRPDSLDLFPQELATCHHATKVRLRKFDPNDGIAWLIARAKSLVLAMSGSARDVL
jgi:hypothetical protein